MRSFYPDAIRKDAIDRNVYRSLYATKLSSFVDLEITQDPTTYEGVKCKSSVNIYSSELPPLGADGLKRLAQDLLQGVILQCHGRFAQYPKFTEDDISIHALAIEGNRVTMHLMLIRFVPAAFARTPAELDLSPDVFTPALLQCLLETT